MKTKKFFSAIAIAIASTALLFSSCSKGDDSESISTTPLTIVKTDPVNGFSTCWFNQTYTIEFSEKIVFDNTNPGKYIEYVEALPTKDFKWTATYDGNKTITIKTTNVSLVSGNEFYWQLKAKEIKTPDGRPLQPTAGFDDYWLHYFNKK